MPAPKSRRLAIIIVHYNTLEWTRQCLQSLEKFDSIHQRKDVEVLLVDNASTDGSGEKLRKEFGWVKFFQTDRNLGFAGGNNVALRETTAEYVMLLNSDTEFTEKTNVDQLCEYLDQHPEVAVVSPRIELANGQLDWASHRGEPTIWAAATYYSGLAKLFPRSSTFAKYHLSFLNLNTIHQIDACSGAAMVLRATAIAKIGLLDERFFMYAEDLDWCRRFREAGYSIVFFPMSVVRHHKYKSGTHQKGETARRTRMAFYDTMLQYFDKHDAERYPFWVRWLMVLFISVKKGVG